MTVSSVILLEVDAPGVAILECERDAPGPVHVDRIARGFETSQGMEVETGNVHFFRLRGDVPAIDATQYASMHLRVDLPRPPLLPKLGKALAFEVPDHIPQCKLIADYSQPLAYSGARRQPRSRPLRRLFHSPQVGRHRLVGQHGKGALQRHHR